MPTLILLFVAAGLLVLAGTGIGRVRGRPVSRNDAAVMAGMTGVAVAFLGTVMAVLPLLLFPVAIGGVLVATWTARRQWDQLGAFLVGGGGLVAAMQGVALANDLADPAVSITGWTPIPLAAAVAATIIGIAVLIADRRGRTEPGLHDRGR